MAGVLSPLGGAGWQFLNSVGAVLNGGFLWSYAAGTTTPLATGTDSTLSVNNLNPIVLSSAGRPTNPSGNVGEIWLQNNVGYKFVLMDANSVVQGTWDNIVGINSAQSTTGGVVGSSRGAYCAVAANSALANFSAAEVVLESALGGSQFKIGNVAVTFNTATDMDSGTLTASYVGMYLIYNPTTQVLGRLLVNSTNFATLPDIYGNGHMPAGYTHSALVGVWPCSNPNFLPGVMLDRHVTMNGLQVVAIGSPSATLTNYQLGSLTANARTIDIQFQVVNGATGLNTVVLITGNPFLDSTIPSKQELLFGVPGVTYWGQILGIPIFIANNFYAAASSSNISSLTINVFGYTF